MNRRRRPYAVLLQLAFGATLLMALAPLVSRWQQAHGDPVMLMPGGMAHVMPAEAEPARADIPPAQASSPPAMTDHDMHTMGAQGASTHATDMHDRSMQSASTHDASMHHMTMHDTPAHAMPGEVATPAERAVPAPIDPHAGHGEACEYCMMASRLMPWLAVLILLLPALPVIAPTLLRAVALPRSLRWPAHAARGPPLHA